MSDRIKGFCPMGCGETLFVGSGGYLTCGYLECPDPTALARILDNRETEHVVVFNDVGFTIEHPLRERADGEMFDCGLIAYCSSLDGPPVQPGRYRSTPRPNGGWQFSRLGDAPDSPSRRAA